jgi:hypothetical protein
VFDLLAAQIQAPITQVVVVTAGGAEQVEIQFHHLTALFAPRFE